MVNKFPNNPENKQIYIDSNNIKWEYDALRNKWSRKGKLEEIPIVNQNTNGIITPEIFEKLKTLQEATSELDLNIFKIAPGVNAYYYYFYSPDKLIDIRHKGNGTIQIDVNEQKLVSYLYRYLCIGDTGKQGITGNQGEPGLQAPNEATFKPTYGEDFISGQAYVPIPIGTYYLENEAPTNISLRFYQRFDTQNISTAIQENYWVSVITNPLLNQAEKAVYSKLQQKILEQSLGLGNYGIELSQIILNQLTLIPATLLEIDINPENGETTIISNGVGANIENSEISFDKEIGLLKFKIFAEWPQEIIWKARQRGPTGKRGNIPNNYLILQTCEFPDDSNVRPDSILIHLRPDCEEGKIFANFARLESQDAFSLVSTDVTLGPANTKPIHEGNFVAVQKIAGPIKRIVTLSKDTRTIEVDEPLLQNWSPQPGCVTKRRYNDQNFDWIPKTDIPACDTKLTWFGPEGIRTGKYPFDIVKGAEPEQDDCCQDDFFYFPESGDC